MTTGNGWSANQRARDLLAPLGLAPARVLDLGAGTGQTAVVLRELFPAAALTLVDPSPGMLALARGKVPDAEVVAADAESFLRARDGEWDLVTAIGFLELLPDLFEVPPAGRRAAGARRPPGGEPRAAAGRRVRAGHPGQRGGRPTTGCGATRARRSSVARRRTASSASPRRSASPSSAATTAPRSTRSSSGAPRRARE